MIPAGMGNEAVSTRYQNAGRTQIEDLYWGAVDLERAGNSGECCEINFRRLRVRAREF